MWLITRDGTEETLLNSLKIRPRVAYRQALPSRVILKVVPATDSYYKKHESLYALGKWLLVLTANSLRAFCNR